MGLVAYSAKGAAAAVDVFRTVTMARAPGIYDLIHIKAARLEHDSQ